MTCDGLRDELMGFHFGTLDPDTRLRVEAHLLACRGCLEAFLAIKRAVEGDGMDAEDVPAPSAASRARLRLAVAAEVDAPRHTPTPWRWWERAVPLGLAAATMLLSLGVVHAVATSPGAMPHGVTTTSALP